MRFYAAILMLFISSIMQGYAVQILESPVTQRVVASGTVTFQCQGTGEMGWFVNDQYVYSTYRQSLENDGFDFDTYRETNYSLLIMIAPAVLSRNGTEIQCEAYSTSQTMLSDVVWLWIICPPLTPNVSVELTSWNTMRLSWTAPFTADGYPIIKYIILTTNSSTGQRSQTDVYPTDGNESLSIVDTPSDCHSLQFEIIAQNSAGNSSSHNISVGFLIAIEDIQVNLSLSLSDPELTPQATITFYLPDVCGSDSGVLATYILEVRTVSGVLVNRTESQYYESSKIEETLTVDRCTFYSINVSVFIPSFPELGNYTNISSFYIPIGCQSESTGHSSKTSQAMYQSTSISESQKFGTPTKSIALDIPKDRDSSEDRTDTTVALSVSVAVLLLIVLTGSVVGVVTVFFLRRRRLLKGVNKPPLTIGEVETQRPYNTTNELDFEFCINLLY